MDQNLLDRLERVAARVPHARAVADQDTVFTFSQLQTTAKALAVYLLQQNLGGKTIAVYARHEAWTPVLFLGVLYAGSAYVPLDEDAPAEKLSKILTGSGAAALLCHGHGPEGAISVTEDLLSMVTPDDAALEKVYSAIGPDSLAYIVYTSGSTGIPKGVAKSHGAVLSYLDAFTSLYDFSEKNIMGNQTPFFFDASAKDLYLMLSTGASLEVIPKELFSFPVKLIEYLNEKKVDTISWVPSALSIVTQLNTFIEILPQTLRRVFFVGEVFPMKQLNKWRAALPEITYVNLYGSSEIAGIACYFPVVGEFSDGDSLPIGTGLPNCQIRLVSDGKVVTSQDTVGEIYISSPALAQGYYGDPEKTAAVFQLLDLGDGLRRWFATGDMARYDKDGRLVFAARRDYQIKFMGRRIELGEIEVAASALDGIRSCCCLYNAPKQKIILFCQTEPDSQLTGRDIRKLLREKLSDYMVPARVKVLDAMPLNANGKIDRQALTARLDER